MIRSEINHIEDFELINYREVNSLLAVEFLHDLYNRHNPEINSIRFRNTIVEYLNNEVFSYAPKREWDMVKRYFGEKLLNADKEYFQTFEAFIYKGHKPTEKLIKKFENVDFSLIEEQDLAQVLIDLHYIPLGDIYEINLVQIEYALNYAVKQELNQLNDIGESDGNEILTHFISSEESTVATKRKVALAEIAQFCLEKNLNPLKINENSELAKVLDGFCKQWGSVGVGYGLNDKAASVQQELNELIKENPLAIEARTKSGNQELVGDRFNELKFKDKNGFLYRCDLIKKIGELRDSNKALLGRVNKIKHNLTKHIKKIKSTDVNWYLLNEILNLLEFGKYLDEEIIESRKNGVVFKRGENMTNLVSSVHAAKMNAFNSKNGAVTIKGICASSGKVAGQVAIVRSTDDLLKITADKIMVAPGTDFNVLDGMLKAKAIVTEEGGILSHAAVVAREHNKPCVIGAQYSTSLLKDGDWIEVDASAGLIKKNK